MEKVAALLAQRIQAMRTSSKPASAYSLAYIEEHYGRHARDPSIVKDKPRNLAGRRLDLDGGLHLKFDDYLSRLHLDPLRGSTQLEFVQLALSGFGSALIEVHYASDTIDCCVSVDMFESDERVHYHTTPICLKSLPPGGNLYVKIQTQLDKGASISNMNWQGRGVGGLTPAGIKLVLVRTFGNRDLVISNLTEINRYLIDSEEDLQDYLFVVYDATGRDEPALAPAFPKLNIFEMAGENYGGGGNASFLAALVRLADQQLPEEAISEMILWDDDAYIEPQMLLRHRGFVKFRRDNVAHTAMIMDEDSPSMVQEYGGIWGGYFARGTHQLDLSLGLERRNFPYLVRHGRLLGRDVNVLSEGQDIEFGTFIFLSLPMALMRKLNGPVPFFLRNDDVDFCLRIREAGGELIGNQNILAWHGAAHSFSGEFFATLHGWIVNNTHFQYSVAEFLTTLLHRLHASHGVGNYPLLFAYHKALELYGQGPAWFKSQDVFSTYLSALSALRSSQQMVSQVPDEILETLQDRAAIEIHDLYDGSSRQMDSDRSSVFMDKSDAKYYRIEASREELDSKLLESVVACADIARNYDQLGAAWRDAMREFNLLEFWLSYSKDNPHFVREIVSADAESIVTDQGKSSWATSARVRAALWRIEVAEKRELEDDLPPDFDPELYLRLNPDVKKAGLDARLHYLRRGMRENRKYR